uniref:Variant surface glycoprotein n=1 Tax=Trypanosoma brucei TaxID=5691 RepID=A0A1V0FZR2_9TRYP|nr:variant surface glycoprotein [Trypanosoma brucei]
MTLLNTKQYLQLLADVAIAFAIAHTKVTDSADQTTISQPCHEHKYLEHVIGNYETTIRAAKRRETKLQRDIKLHTLAACKTKEEKAKNQHHAIEALTTIRLARQIQSIKEYGQQLRDKIATLRCRLGQLQALLAKNIKVAMAGATTKRGNTNGNDVIASSRSCTITVDAAPDMTELCGPESAVDATLKSNTSALKSAKSIKFTPDDAFNIKKLHVKVIAIGTISSMQASTSDKKGCGQSGQQEQREL